MPVFISLIGILMLCARDASGQSPIIPAILDLRLDGGEHHFPVGSFFPFSVGPDGTIAWGDHSKPDVHLVAADGSPRGTLSQRVVPGARVVYGVGSLGWAGDSVWVRWGPAVSIIPIAGPVARTISLEMDVHGPVGSTPVHHQGPFIAAPKAVFPGGGMLLYEMTKGFESGVAVPDRATGILVRVADTGSFLSLVGFRIAPIASSAACRIPMPDINGGVQSEGGAVFCNLPSNATAPNGGRIVSMKSLPVEGDSTRFSLDVVDESGKKLSSQQFAFLRIGVTARDVDSALAELTFSWRTASPKTQKLVETARKARSMVPLASERPPLRLLVGNDGSVWVEIPLKAPGHHWMVIAEGKTLIGVVTVPAAVKLTQVSAALAWGIESHGGPQGPISLVRYRLPNGML